MSTKEKVTSPHTLLRTSSNMCSMSAWYWLVLDDMILVARCWHPATLHRQTRCPAPILTVTRQQASRCCEHPLFLRPAAVMIWFTTLTLGMGTIVQIYHLVSVFRWVKFLCVLNPVVWKSRSLSAGANRQVQCQAIKWIPQVSSKAHQCTITL